MIQRAHVSEAWLDASIKVLRASLESFLTALMKFNFIYVAVIIMNDLHCSSLLCDPAMTAFGCNLTS